MFNYAYGIDPTRIDTEKQFPIKTFGWAEMDDGSSACFLYAPVADQTITLGEVMYFDEEDQTMEGIGSSDGQTHRRYGEWVAVAPQPLEYMYQRDQWCWWQIYGFAPTVLVLANSAANVRLYDYPGRDTNTTGTTAGRRAALGRQIGYLEDAVINGPNNRRQREIERMVLTRAAGHGLLTGNQAAAWLNFPRLGAVASGTL